MKKLAIVGSGAETRDNAPFDDLDFDIWVFNEAGNSTWCKRWSAVFQMHKPEIYQGHNTKDPQHWQWLQRHHGKPIYMQERDPQVPDSVRFPIEDAVNVTGLDYFASSFAYISALALLQGYEEIHIYGVELSMSEYQYQAECWRYWIGVMKGRLGADNVVLHSGMKLFESVRYGYEGNFAFGVDFFTARVNELNEQWQLAQKDAQYKKRAVDNALEKKLFNMLPALVSAYQKAVQDCGMVAGALAEAERYQTFGNRYADRGGFEFAAAKSQQDAEEKRILMFSRVGLIEYLGNVWKQSRADVAMKQLKNQIEMYGQLSEEHGAHLGMYHENISYMQKYDAMVQAHGGAKKETEQHVNA